MSSGRVVGTLPWHRVEAVGDYLRRVMLKGGVL